MCAPSFKPLQNPIMTLRGYGLAGGARVLVLGATSPAQSGALASAEAAHLSSQARRALPVCAPAPRASR